MTIPEPLLPVLSAARETVLLLDFDGSIAPIVDDPATAEPLPAMTDALTRLAPALGLTGIVSGRPVRYLRDALPVDGLVLVGLYGLERSAGDDVVVDPRAEQWRAPISAAADEAAAALPDLLVERKSDLCVTIHYRTAPARAADARAVADALARRYGIDAPQRGRMAVELRPPVPVDKGTVVADLARGARVAVFAGDDAGDLPAFAALRDLVAAGDLGRAVTIGVRSPEAPAGILDAEIVVDGPPELAELLGELARGVSAPA